MTPASSSNSICASSRSGPRQRFPKLHLWLAVLVVSSPPLACDDSAPEAEQVAAPVQRVKIHPVQVQALRSTVSVPATLAPQFRAAITPQVGGTLLSVYKERGDPVEQGERLVRIAATDFRLQLDQAKSGVTTAEAGLAQAEANLVNAEQQYERYKKLRAGNAVTEAEFERVEGAYRAAVASRDAARSQINSAQTGIRSAKKLMSDTTLEAPFSGFVVARHFDPGEAVSPMARPILEIVNIDVVYAEGAFSELDAAKLKLDQETTVTIDAFGEERFRGRIRSIAQQIDPMTRTIGVRVELDNAEHRLKSGMSGTIELDLGTIEAVAVPRIALVDRRGRDAKIFVAKDGVAHERSVVIDPRFTELVPVLSGLEAGETVVIWGQAKLRDGEPLEVDESADSIGSPDEPPKTQTPTPVAAKLGRDRSDSPDIASVPEVSP